MSQDFETENVALDKLRPHPQNYRAHPEDQIEQLAQSIKEHGVYKNVVVARDYTILAGHGAVLACRKLGYPTIPVYKVDCDPFSPKAIKIIIGDNSLSNLAEDDDRALTEMLKTLKESDDLFGTGFDEQMLAGLLMVTRPESEIRTMNEAAEWVGMPEYTPVDLPIRLVISFDTEERREEFMKLINATIIQKKSAGVLSKTWSIWWPERQKQDLASLRFDSKGKAKVEEAK